MNLSIHTLGCIYNPNRDTDCLREGILSAHGTYYWLLVKQGTLRICHMGGKQDERHSGIYHVPRLLIAITYVIVRLHRSKRATVTSYYGNLSSYGFP